MTVSLHDLTNPTKLRAFIDATAGMTGASASKVLHAIVDVLERQLCLRSDDLDEARRLGRLVQVARVQPRPGPRRRSRY